MYATLYFKHLKNAASMMTKEELPASPVATTVQLIESKWKLYLLKFILMFFKEIVKIPHIF